MGLKSKNKGFFGLLPKVALLGVLLLTQRETLAASSSGIFETIGVGIAVGTVLGASTLPFYDQPSGHLKNIAIGAGIGAAVGVGVLVFGGIFGGSSDEDHAGVQSWDRSEADLRAAFREPQKLPLLSRSIAHVPMVSLTW
jgi:hypothetical protein